MPRPLLRAFLALALGASSRAGTVPPFSLKQLDGALFKLDDHLKKQVIVLDFWATWCVPCTKALKKLQGLREKFPDVLVLAAAIDDGRTLAEVGPYVQGRGFTFTVLLDSDASVCRMFNPEGAVPYTMVIDKRGALAYSHSGYLPGDEQALFAAVAKLDR